MKLFNRIIIVACCGALLSACQTETDVMFNQGGPYKRVIEPILNRSCNSGACHATSTALNGNLSLATYQALIAGSRFGNVIVPFNPIHSDLFTHMNRDTTIAEVSDPAMPPAGDTSGFSQSDRDSIYQWILRGARADDDNSIPYSSWPKGVALVTNQAEDLVAVIDINTQQVVRYIRAGAASTFSSPPHVPHNIAIDRLGRNFYVTEVATNELLKFDFPSLQQVSSVNVGTSPAHVVLDATGDTAYVTNWDVTAKTDRSVRIVHTPTMRVIDSVYDARMIAPHGERLSHTGQFLFTANNYSDNVSRINVYTREVAAMIPMAPDVPANPGDAYVPKYKPVQVALGVNDEFVYVTCNATNDVRVIDIATDSVIAVIPVGRGPIQARTSPSGEWVLVANREDSSVTVIRTINNSVFTTVREVGVQPHGIEFTPDGSLAYITCESQNGGLVHHPTAGSHAPGTTAVIEVPSFTLKQIKAGTSIEMGSFPAGVAIFGRND